ncbi:unnamed protein product, partial [Owenia fusiformis]
PRSGQKISQLIRNSSRSGQGNKAVVTLFICPLCQAESISQKGLVTHIKAAHDNVSFEEAIKILGQCRICGLQLHNYDHMSAHIELEHSAVATGLFFKILAESYRNIAIMCPHDGCLVSARSEGELIGHFNVHNVQMNRCMANTTCVAKFPLWSSYRNIECNWYGHDCTFATTSCKEMFDHIDRKHGRMNADYFYGSFRATKDFKGPFSK